MAGRRLELGRQERHHPPTDAHDLRAIAGSLLDEHQAAMARFPERVRAKRLLGRSQCQRILAGRRMDLGEAVQRAQPTRRPRVPIVQKHGGEAHRMEVSREQVLAMAKQV